MAAIWLRIEMAADQICYGPEQLHIENAARCRRIKAAADQIDYATEQLHIGMAARWLRLELAAERHGDMAVDQNSCGSQRLRNGCGENWLWSKTAAGLRNYVSRWLRDGCGWSWLRIKRATANQPRT